MSNANDFRRTQNLCIAGALLLACFLAYWPALRGEFLWDDDRHVSENRALRSLDGLRRIWFERGASPQYYPLTHTSFWVEYQLWGTRTLGYHIDNVLLHALNAILVWRLLTKLGCTAAQGWLTACLFALHPLQLESVAWISERKNVLSLCFELLAFIWWTERSFPVASLVLFILAMLSKTVACSMPAVMLLLIWWNHGRVGTRQLIHLVPFFAIGLLGAWNTARMERGTVGAVGPDWDITLVDRAIIAGRAIWFYAAKLLWPANLIFSYPRWTLGAPGAYLLFPAMIVGVIAALWLLRRRVGRGPVVAVLIFCGVLVPALGFVNTFPMRYSFVADHFQYAAGIALIAMVVAMLRRAAPIAMLVMVILGVLTWQRAHVYANPEALWRDTIAKNDSSWMARYNLGVVLSSRGDAKSLEEALALFDEVERLRPAHEQVDLSRAIALSRAGRWDDAIASYGRALTRFGSPTGEAEARRAAGIHEQIARSLVNLGRFDEAETSLRQAIAIDPRFRDAYLNLIALLRRQGRADAVIATYESLLRNRPDDPDSIHDLAASLALSGRDPEAIERYREYLRLAPDDASSQVALGMLLGQTGRFDDAIQSFTKALAIDPNLSAARDGLQMALAAKRQAATSQPRR